MKKLLLLFAAVGMIFTACEAGGGLDEGGNGDLPSNKIATIAEQSANITATIATLETTKAAVNATIASLNEQQPVTRGNDNGNNGVKDMIAALEERLAALEQMIANLKEYADGDLSEMQDWAEATFATMEQYNALASELATLKALLEGFEGVSTTELSKALAASEQSMKQWVNEQLSGYATIADVEAQIAVLKEGITSELSEQVEKVVATLTALMNDTKNEYKKAIADAIQNQGIINDKIAEDIANINKRIDEELATINKRLDDIEKRLDEIEEALENLVNRIQSISYIKKYGDEPTPIMTSAEGASITLAFEISPKNAVEGLELKWKEYVKVKAIHSGAEDFVDMPITSFSADKEKGIITVVASGENLSQEFYTGRTSVSLRLEISDGNNDIRSEYITIVPQRWMAEGIDLTPANNEIYYITTDGNALEPNSESDFGAEIVSNTYDYNKGCFVLKFDGDISQIGDYAFGAIEQNVKTWTTLKYVAMPKSISYLGYYAFGGCDNLVSIDIPEGVTLIKEGAFRWCVNLSSITIPKTVMRIGTYTFWKCDSLSRLYISDLSAWCRIDFVLESELSDSKTVYANPLMKKPTLYLNNEEVVELVIPEDITEIKDRTFYGFRGTKVVLHDGITKIGERAFAVCQNLTEINLPNTITEIGSQAFVSNQSLTTITLPNNITKIEDGLFSQCSSLAKLTIPESITTIGRAAFYKSTSLTNITIPKSVTSIGERAFAECIGELIINSKIIEEEYPSDNRNHWLYESKFSKITLGDNVTKIGKRAFYYYDSLVSFTIPNSVTSIGDHSFEGCNSLTTITIPDSVTEIGEWAFGLCTSLASITIPDRVTSIGSYAFNSCTSLTSITIPDSVTSIGARAFNLCEGELIINNKIIETDYTADTAPNTTTHWLYYSKFTKITLGKGITRIGNYAFYVYKSLEKIVIPDGITTIGDYAFTVCDLLTNIAIPNSVTSIGVHAFRDCISLSSVTIPDRLTSIGGYAFFDCTSLTSITIPNSVTSIGNCAFSGCYSLTNTTIPNSVTSIGNRAFRDCTSMTSITIPESVTEIGVGAFDGCTGELIIDSKVLENNYTTSTSNLFTGSLFTKVSIGNNVTKLGNYLFFNLANHLTEVKIGNGVTSIGSYTFADCIGLENITIPSSVSSININAFRGCTQLASVSITDLSAWCKINFAAQTSNPIAINGAKLNLNGAEITDLIIPSDIKEINNYAFYKCSGLTSITLPESIISIGNRAFMYCTATEIYCKSLTPPNGHSEMFSKNRPIYVPRNSVEAYKSALYWSDYADYIVGYDF